MVRGGEQVPTLAVVENMAYFHCPSCQDKHHIFGQEASKFILKEFPSIPPSAIYSLPLSPKISMANEKAVPLMVDQPQSSEAQVRRRRRRRRRRRGGNSSRWRISLDVGR